MKKYSLMVALFVLFSLIVLPVTTAQQKEPIRIGLLTFLTGEGAEMGIEHKMAVELATDLLNAKGGIHGYPVSLTIMDHQSKAAVASAKAHRLIESIKVIGSVSNLGVQYGGAVMAFQDAKTVSMEPSATTPGTPLAGDYIFQVPMPDNDQGRAVAKYIYEKLGYDTVSIFKDVGSVYGTKLTEYIIHFLKEFTGKENPAPFVPAYNCGDSDYMAQLIRLKVNIKKLGIQAIVLPTWPRDAPKIAKQARELAIELPLVGTDGVDTAALTEVGGNAVEGIVYSTHFSVAQPGLPDSVKYFLEEFERRYEEGLGAFGAGAYDGFIVLTEAISGIIEEKGEEWWDEASLADKRIATRDKIASTKFTSTTLPLSFTPEGWPKKAVVWKIVKNGKRCFYDFQPYESYTPEGIETLPFM